MICSRCAGLMVEYDSMKLDPLEGDTAAPARRCINCGHVIEAVMLLNRASRRSGEHQTARARDHSDVGGATKVLRAIVVVVLLLMLGCAGEEHRPERGRVVVPRGGGTIGVPWESQFPSKSAVRFRDEVTVAAQLGWDEQGRIAEGLDAQTRQAYANVVKALETGGATLQDVVDETIFVTDMTAALSTVPAVRLGVYGGNPTVASTMIEVKRLSDPNARIAIKVIAKLNVSLPREGPLDGPSRGGRSRGGPGRSKGGGMGGGPF